MDDNLFIIRVYGIFIDKKKGLLVSDEYVYGQNMTKFPGGGLEYGEGLRDCLKREFLEETGYEFEILEHLYTTDFFVASAFHENRQIVSVYYRVKPVGNVEIKATKSLIRFSGEKEREQSLRWLDLSLLKVEDFNFPIDKHVASMLINEKFTLH
ncbi:MAG TPA: NUDIX domain-containing protein [Bacteroidia bacterium]|nr:NUDIX domain-containing protein [Bacteroidia bacterium]